ncbi:hypothetical protein [Synechococcus sp. 1G10]|uniref:hypothetical protein n=1 Tax=Synechococcus sp. 1G10 TaxID=2025605 RepID=UPI000B99A80F|nr:hypothetical protein [Synechococcus sp. 1G10]
MPLSDSQLIALNSRVFASYQVAKLNNTQRTIDLMFHRLMAHGPLTVMALSAGLNHRTNKVSLQGKPQATIDRSFVRYAVNQLKLFRAI